MALNRDLYECFTAGSLLFGPPDLLPNGALRFGQNVRIDRERFAVTSRPGISLLSSALTYTVLSLHRRYASGVTTTYAEAGGHLWRNADTATPASIAASIPTATPTTSAMMQDGAEVTWAYFVNHGALVKDNGTTAATFGIAAPGAAPTTAALAADLATVINACDNAGAWTGTTLTAGPADEATIKQEGADSMTFTIAANTVGVVAIGGLGGGAGFLNLDTLTGGDASVKDDDYLFFWFRADRPDRVLSIQVDVDLDTQTVANAFVTNYYSARLPGITRLNQGSNQWTKVQVRKSEFQRFGTNAALSWAVAKAIRFSVLVSTEGAVVCYLDDIKLRGGTDIEGAVEYTVAYRNSVTGGRGNPPLDSAAHVRYTTPLTVDRQRVSVTTTNVRRGGANASGDAQIDTLILYRRINGGFSVNIDEIAYTAASPYLDTVSVFATSLNEVLEDTPEFPGSEAENDLPPAFDLLFGPGATNRLFGLVGNTCYFSKAWQQHENRAENWPPLQNFLVAGGSERALTGLVSDTQIALWTDRRTYQVLGGGADTYLPVPIQDSKGTVGRKSVAEGDSRMFFWANDGLWQQVGLQQTKLVDMGETLQAPAININVNALAVIEMAWHADTRGPMLVSLIPTGASLTPDKRLVVKKNVLTNQYTDVFLDDSPPLIIRSLCADLATNTLLGGAEDGTVSVLEDQAVETDHGAGVTITVDTPSHHQGYPHRPKQYGGVLVEGNTQNQALTASVRYDKRGSTEALGTFLTNSAVGDGQWTPVDPLALRQDVALRLTGTVTQRVTIYRYGFYYELQPEAVTYLDTGVLVLPKVQSIQRYNFDVYATAPVVLQAYYEGRAAAPLTTVLGVRREYQRLWCPANIKARILRVTLTSVEPFIPYGLTVRSKPLAAGIGYADASLLSGAATQFYQSVGSKLLGGATA